ncbi:uncharacterized protein AFUA_2G10680 [Aspergillus fumigatus Af293]|uniref:Uncharacterized protein n=2 Tax=Aspergillus fumigatus TaxID=746128 RepID=Q4X1A2_ASPFU|nr:hypothetical protein AFUA_2G10680 [Aspergillus fumigatus Af293]EAL93363.1 hypothetical protein AFUA_2G10680 [Aspergillus fumigatus Af293]EDP54587.1 hypothetical protein AFUB_026460 [Aspergillus fumigatus A1163]
MRMGMPITMQQLKSIPSRFIPSIPFADKDGKDFIEKQHGGARCIHAQEKGRRTADRKSEPGAVSLPQPSRPNRDMGQELCTRM